MAKNEPALGYDSKGIVDLPAETIKAVDNLVVPNGYRREGAREWSVMYSLRVYTIPTDTSDERHKYFCLPSANCRRNKAFPCKGGDHSNGNTHHKNRHKLRGAGAGVKGKRRQ